MCRQMIERTKLDIINYLHIINLQTMKDSFEEEKTNFSSLFLRLLSLMTDGDT